jgi:hypothetical protein
MAADGFRQKTEPSKPEDQGVHLRAHTPSPSRYQPYSIQRLTNYTY